MTIFVTYRSFDCKQAKRINVHRSLLKKQPFKFYLSLKNDYFCNAKKLTCMFTGCETLSQRESYNYILHLCLLKKEKRLVRKKASKTLKRR